MLWLTKCSSNQTNLAIKGIIGLQAMSEVEKLLGNADGETKYGEIAAEYYEFWTQHGINKDASPPHTTLQYDTPDSYGLSLV
jgi:hypothetical protein